MKPPLRQKAEKWNCGKKLHLANRKKSLHLGERFAILRS